MQVGRTTSALRMTVKGREMTHVEMSYARRTGREHSGYGMNGRIYKWLCKKLWKSPDRPISDHFWHLCIWDQVSCCKCYRISARSVYWEQLPKRNNFGFHAVSHQTLSDDRLYLEMVLSKFSSRHLSSSLMFPLFWSIFLHVHTIPFSVLLSKSSRWL